MLNTIKMYIIVFLTFCITLIFGSFIMLDKSFEVTGIKYIPSQKFTLYEITNQSVSVKFLNIIIVSAAAAVVSTAILLWVSFGIKSMLNKKGMN